MNSSCYITTSIPYVNAAPHIGHALELVQADTIARYFSLCGTDVILQTGTDENAQKNVTSAKQLGVSVQELVDQNAQKFRRLVTASGCSPQSFIRTTEGRHRSAVQELWRELDQEDLYQRAYRGMYCEGCEDFLSDRDLVEGKCPEHLVRPIEVEEKNYFFRLSRYQDRLFELIKSDTIRIFPTERKREVLAFIGSGLHDISVSRQAARTNGWGIPVPGDATQVIYVWIDALINYISGIGYGVDDSWREIWGSNRRKIHIIGKNVWKFHAVYWPALLLSAGLQVPDDIIVHGFLTNEGRKISKSLGNSIDPFQEIDLIGSDPLRFYLLSLSTYNDGDYSRSGLIDAYNRQIAGRLGSTVTRLTALAERFGLKKVALDRDPAAPESFHSLMSCFRLDRALEKLMEVPDAVNAEVAKLRPWEGGVDRPFVMERLQHWLRKLHATAHWLRAFIPEYGERVCQVLSWDPLRKPESLFPKKNPSS